MLRELRVENLLLIERAELELADGLNVLTGETGAGKTVLAQALDLLMGGTPRSRGGGLVRPGAQSAYVEGVFSVPQTLRTEIEQLLPESLREDGCGEELALARRLGADGRTRAFVGGRSAGAADLRDLGSRLISFYGQHEHRKLVLAAAQLQMLDAVCGPAHEQRLRGCAESFARTRELQSELQRLAELELAREQELGLLQHELAEIDEAAPDAAEHATLLATRERLRSVESLGEAAARALEAIAPESGEAAGAAHLLAAAAGALGGPAGIDAELDALAARARTLAIEAGDLAGASRAYVEGVNAEEGSLQSVEERLAGLERLLRKHGGTIEAVLEHGERARARAQELSGAERAQEQARAELEQEQSRLDGYVSELRQARRQAAVRLGEAVHEQLAALAMPDASFAIELSATEPRAGGADAVEFAIAPNPGVPAAPLRETASGGELSRVMLALASACEQAAAAPNAGAARSTLVFDEIDAGIGGHTARAVGERLQALARGRQLICITHLPQIASLAERHFTVSKDTVAGATLTTVTRLAERDVERELVRMLGAGEGDAGARKHARELRRAA
ncbi:MAG TPA: DNA repair protein RecN [Solirubrobacteraceae bacterium]|nr:DNA repair protein RecN [Solirubrobacteraceae bacterium]